MEFYRCFAATFTFVIFILLALLSTEIAKGSDDDASSNASSPTHYENTSVVSNAETIHPHSTTPDPGQDTNLKNSKSSSKNVPFEKVVNNSTFDQFQLSTTTEGLNKLNDSEAETTLSTDNGTGWETSTEQQFYVPLSNSSHLGIELGSDPLVEGCLCDLLSPACDLNCCCDLDCSADDKLSFSFCIPTFRPPALQYCIQKNAIIFNNTRFILEQKSPNLFCIASDNIHLAASYRSLPPANSMEELDAVWPETIFSWNDYLHQPKISHFPPQKAGEPLMISFDSGHTVLPWALPSKSFDGSCQTTSSIKYLHPYDVTCHRYLSLKNFNCATNPVLQATSYLTGMLISGRPLNRTQFNNVSRSKPFDNETSEWGDDDNLELFDLGNITSLCVNHSCSLLSAHQYYIFKERGGLVTPVENESIPAPSYDSINKVCHNVVSGVRYKIYHNGTMGIYKVDVIFELSDLNANEEQIDFTLNPDEIFIKQHFSVEFLWKSAVPPIFKRSGNPGYLEGLPVIAGRLKKVHEKGTVQKMILLPTDQHLWMNVLSPSGYCIQETAPLGLNRIPVHFRESLKTGCLLAVNFAISNCELVQEWILELLRGSQPPTHVARFGNPEVGMVERDWVPITIVGEPTKPYLEISDGVCPSIVTGLDILIFYGWSGPKELPQARITSVKYQYASPQEISPICVGPFCLNSNVTQYIQVSTSVSFVDVSLPPEPVYASLPTIDIHLPYDFFYPFYLNSATPFSCCCWHYCPAFFLAVYFS